MKIEQITQMHFIKTKTQQEYDSVKEIFSKVSTPVFMQGFVENTTFGIGFIEDDKSAFTDGRFTEVDPDYTFIPAADFISANKQ